MRCRKQKEVRFSSKAQIKRNQSSRKNNPSRVRKRPSLFRRPHRRGELIAIRARRSCEEVALRKIRQAAVLPPRPRLEQTPPRLERQRDQRPLFPLHRRLFFRGRFRALKRALRHSGETADGAEGAWETA